MVNLFFFVLLLGINECLAEFEQEFEKYLSKSSIQTKFEQYTYRRREILNLLSKILINLINKSQFIEHECNEKLIEMDEKE